MVLARRQIDEYTRAAPPLAGEGVGRCYCGGRKRRNDDVCRRCAALGVFYCECGNTKSSGATRCCNTCRYLDGPTIASAEVIHFLRLNGPSTVQQIVEGLGHKFTRQRHNTTQVMLLRLKHKGRVVAYAETDGHGAPKFYELHYPSDL